MGYKVISNVEISVGQRAGVAAPFAWSGPAGLAQASQAAAPTSPMEFATRRVSSIEAMGEVNLG